VKTLKASLLASAIGTGAWILGLTRAMWPAHPQLAVFFLTIGATAVLNVRLARAAEIAKVLQKTISPLRCEAIGLIVP
jgi:hypothetical protein